MIRNILTHATHVTCATHKSRPPAHLGLVVPALLIMALLALPASAAGPQPQTPGAGLTGSSARAATSPSGSSSRQPEGAQPDAVCPPGGQCFTDVLAANPFYAFVNRIYMQDIVSGYPCGGEGEPCDDQGRPYYRPANNVTRQQMAKFIDNARNLPGFHIDTNWPDAVIYINNTTDVADARGVYAECNACASVVGVSTSGDGVQGTSDSNDGVRGTSNTGEGVHGISTSSAGVEGNSDSNDGVRGRSTTGDGVRGTSNSGDGVHGSSTSGYGVYGSSDSAALAAVYGISADGFGVQGMSTSDIGVLGNSDSSYGVYGNSTGSVGVRGFSTNGYGVYGRSSNSTGVYGFTGAANGNWAGYFNGNVSVTGACCQASAGSYRIDDPIDPANKYLYHSAVESPDMMDVYNGNVTTGANGEAIVTMPSYFEALNRDYRYQLTVIGQFAQAIVSSKIADNRFVIKTDKPNVEVSWQVTGIRQDPYANAHRVPVQEDKPAGEQGLYLHPTEYGQPASKGIDYNERQQVEQLPESKP